MTRIVSLIASATEIVHALEMGTHQVGRSHECDFPDSVLSLPVCTAPTFPTTGNSQEIDNRVKETLRKALSVYEVFEEVLEQLQPTHIVTQSQCEVCAVSLREVEKAVGKRLSCQPTVVSLQPDGLNEVWADMGLVAKSLGVETRGEELVESLSQQMDQISNRAQATATRPRVACVEWLEPLMAAGNWMPDLVAMAGGENLLGESGKHSSWMSWEELARSDPDILLVLPCGFDMKRTREEMYWLTDRSEWSSLKAVQEGRVYVTDGHQYFNRPGPRLMESLQILTEIIHPEVFDADFEGIGWQRF
jgi:iron complex transport system substrate-binding protein